MLTLFQIINPVLPAEVGSGDGSVILGNIVSALVSFSLLVATLGTLMFLLLGGIRWITASGDKQKLQSAQESITHAIVGLIIVAASWAVFVLVTNFVGLGGITEGGINVPGVGDSNTPVGGNKTACLQAGMPAGLGGTCCNGSHSTTTGGKVITICN